MKKRTSGSGKRWLRGVSHGKAGHGKTQFLATWPRPVVFGAAQENGVVTIESMDSSEFYEEGVRPTIYDVETLADIREIPKIAAQEVAKGAQTVVLDSATYLMEIITQEIKTVGKAKWGEVLDEFTKLRLQLYNLPAHVMWSAAMDDDKKILVQGKSSIYLPHASDLLLHHEVVTYTDPSGNPVVEYQVHTNPTRGHFARNRLRLPSPLSVLVDDPEDTSQYIVQNSPTFRALQEALKDRFPI
jgi:hypothetical protein